MMYSLEQCCSLIEAQLEKLEITSGQPERLYAPVAYVLEPGGKRIRPALALMACNLFADDIQSALMPAVAIEIFHNFTLLHDDVMDHADIRRNRPTVHRRWSENTAILSGDAMQILAYQCMCRAKPELLSSLLKVFSDTALEVCEGQQYDMDFESRTDVSIEEYLRMIRLKTAVLLAASLQIGAICGGADRQNAETLYRFGISLGLSFQIQDDWLDAYSDPKIFGKATGGDILSGKKTFLLLTALEQADGTTRQKLFQILNDRKIPNEDKIGQVKAIYDHLGVNRITQQALEVHYQQALSELHQVRLPDNERKEELRKLTAMLLKRSK